MRVSVWVSVSDLVPVRQTLVEKVISLFEKKQTMFHSLSHEYIFQSLRQAGIDGVELLIPRYVSDENIQQVKTILAKNKIPVFSIHQSLSNIGPISISEIERLCYISNIFLSSIIVLHIGTMGKMILYNSFIEMLKHLQKKYKIIFGIENSPKLPLPKKSFTYKATEFSSVMDKAGLLITYDITHLAQAGDDIIQFYLLNKDKIVNIHISDYKKSWSNTLLRSQDHTHLTLLSGELPIEKFLKILMKEKYGGLLTMEINAGLSQLCNSAEIIKKYFN